ncbi:hypothetical protein [Hymenobacter sp. DG25B]|uniref:hypothetical protein n=1 Tax=Hymenobacter sp. DG25B TaxID=1385664 RepID=UPI0012E093C4|nr:hypothetical protein [Hymenobacter sp. DG25B]
MKRVAIVSLLAASFFSFSPKKSLQDQSDSCQAKWQYVVSSKKIKGRVIFHKNTDELCGLLPTASVTLVKTNEGDTIRVLELCNLSKKFANGEFVLIQPDTAFEAENISVPVDPRTCSLKRTYLGKVESISKR